MKFLFFLFVFMNSSFALNFISCNKADIGNYELEIELNAFRSESMREYAQVKLYDGYIFLREGVAKNYEMVLHSLPPQNVRNFNFKDGSFDSLQVNFTRKTAYMDSGLLDQNGRKIEISFGECEFD